MQDRSASGMEHDKKEMIALLNSGDKRELRAFMQLYSKKIYERALDITGDEAASKDAVRKVLMKVAALAEEGALKENIDVQLMTLTDETCSAPVFAAPLVVAEEEAPVQEVCAPQEESKAETEPAAIETAPPAPLYAPPARAESAPVPQVQQPVPLLFEEEDEALPEMPLPRAPRVLQEEEERSASPLLVIGIILLSLLVVFLVWVLVVKMMTTGILPNYDFGFARWFDTHIFEFYY